MDLNVARVETATHNRPTVSRVEAHSVPGCRAAHAPSRRHLPRRACRAADRALDAGKFVFDEVHYVPAARQMLEPVMTTPMLNPMHPPLAKELIALSIRIFGDNALGWRYPAALFGALAIVAIYLCGLALFAGAGTCDRSRADRLLNQMLFVQSRIAMLDIFALAFSLLAHRGVHPRFPAIAAAPLVRPGGLASDCRSPANGAACFRLRSHRHRRRDPPAAALAHPVRRRQSPRLVPAGAVAGFQAVACRRVLYGDSGGGLSRDLRPALRACRLPDLMRSTAPHLHDNTTTAIAGHTYMSSWPSWPMLVRPVWYLFDKTRRRPYRGGGVARQSAGAVAGAVGARCLLRDWIVTRRADAFLILAFYVGPYLAWALLPRALSFLYYYLPSATIASLALVYALAGAATPRAGCCGPLSPLRSRASRRCCRSRRPSWGRRCNVQPVDAVPELDLTWTNSEPGDLAPADISWVEVRQVDRERLPIAVTPVVTMDV